MKIIRRNIAIDRYEPRRLDPRIELQIFRLKILTLRYQPRLSALYKKWAGELDEQWAVLNPRKVQRLRAYIATNQHKWETI